MQITSEYFAVMATALERRIKMMLRLPSKVIALGCDNMLWAGVIGEDSHAGIRITEPYRTLQQFMVEQQKTGRLLALVSKNSEADVWQVWRQRDDLPLQRQHTVAACINWGSKSDTLRALADELQLGLDIFIFVDDNPLECAEVRTAAPEVLVVQLPSDPDEIVPFLQHHWAFENHRVTQEDQQRTQMYQENQERDIIPSCWLPRRVLD